MMTTIKQGIITLLVSFAVFFFMPVITFADDLFPISSAVLVGRSNYYGYSDANLSRGFYFGRFECTSYLSDNPIYGAVWLKPSDPSFYGVRYYRQSSNNAFDIILYGNTFYSLNSVNDFSYRVNTSPTGIGTSSNSQNAGSYNGYYFKYAQRYSDLLITDFSSLPNSSGRPNGWYSTNLPTITTDDWNEFMSRAVSGDFDQPISCSSMGYIKPSYYLDNHVGSSGAYEIITWAPTSTTGIDLTDSRYNVQFALRDKSYTMSAGEKAKINFDTYPNMVEGIGVYLGRKIYNYSHDNVNNAILRGDAVPMSTYNNMVSLGLTSASSRRFAFNAINEYSRSPNFQAAHPEIAANLNNVINANIQEFIPGGFLQRVFNDSNLRNLADFQLSYDIYARITDSQSGTKGNWLLIDKHGRPVKDLENALNGGSTIRPVKVPDFEPSSDFTPAPDDQDIPDEELDDNDTVKDEPLPTGYIDPSSGNGVNNYYNYTYNYDNRTWIENHYDNQTAEEVNEGLEWIKMFPGFFGLFLKFFGAFLPGWAVVCVTIAIPIIIGLLIFKAIKGVIPFV